MRITIDVPGVGPAADVASDESAQTATSSPVTLRIPADLLAEVDAAAEAADRSRSAEIKARLRHSLANFRALHTLVPKE